MMRLLPVLLKVSVVELSVVSQLYQNLRFSCESIGPESSEVTNNRKKSVRNVMINCYARKEAQASSV